MDPDGTPTLHDLADNMVSAPVKLCAVKIDIKQEHTVEDQDDCLLSSFLYFVLSVPDTAEAEQEEAAAATVLGRLSLDDTDLEPVRPVRPPPLASICSGHALVPSPSFTGPALDRWSDISIDRHTYREIDIHIER